MGAGNVGRVYLGWGHEVTLRGEPYRLKDRPFRVLAYMALVSRDQDSEPWFGMSHEDIATFALGLEVPKVGADDPKAAAERDQVLRIVRRHITPLFKAGAIETRRRATTGHQGLKSVVYRLYLDGPWRSSPFPDAPGRYTITADPGGA